ncbi:hypothetical protein CK203_094440 [Vitis vinifera]|uniref:Reverse transcriptase domain-containing protein n=1 Tax=Vitis vinifera TaxID=29760 RepID=A0A438CKU1_VITVI|nr:hypothetical protein CK203_094440 [Vitis vinifera]
MWFEACSGLKINLEKSKLIPVGRVHDIEDLALELSCKVGGLPSYYLGLPLGAPFKSAAVWDGVEECFQKRLTMWKRNEVEIREDSDEFSMGRGALVQKPHLVRWNLVCLDKRQGGGCEKFSSDEYRSLNVWNPIGDGDGWTPLFAKAFND